MTSWPWMKGVEVAIADPIPPVNEYDDRPSVKDLIAKNRSYIDETKAGLEKDALYDPNKHDDLWILRFVLSHQNQKKKKLQKKVVEAAKYTLAFRKKHGLDDDDFRPHAPAAEDNKHPRAASFKKYMKFCTYDALNFQLPDPKRGVIGFLYLTGIDQHKLVQHFPKDEWLWGFLYMSEWSFQWLDFVTRTTGRLTKTLRIANAEGLSLKAINLENQRRDGEAMGLMEDCYPQMLQGIMVCGSPKWIQVPWRIVRPLLPKRVVQKIDFMNPYKNRKERERLYKFIDEKDLPERFGGQNHQWPVSFPMPVSN